MAATFDDLSGVRDLHLEELALDRLVDEDGRWLKDISHEGCRYLTSAELLKVLRVQVPVESYRLGRYGERSLRRGRGRRRGR